MGVRPIWPWLVLALFVACASQRSIPAERPVRYTETGVASYYANALHGRRTANGERYDKHKLTAAHPNLPFGTRVTVINTKSGKRVTVRINDRGPFVRGRIIDLSRAAAQKLGMLKTGVAKVRLIIH